MTVAYAGDGGKWVGGLGFGTQELVPGWKHALVENSTDDDCIASGLIEDDVLALFDTAKAAMDFLAGSTEVSRPGNAGKAFDEAIEI
jgi:hypothetical protein